MTDLDLVAQAFVEEGRDLFARVEAAGFPFAEKMELINQLRDGIHQISPMKNQPVDNVRWFPSSQVQGNAYNPNEVAKRTMKALKASVSEDGFTQPIVGWPGEQEGVEVEVVDGFHRHLVGKEIDELHGYLPVAMIRPERTSLADRIASTWRHNKARGEHIIAKSSEVLRQLSREGKSDEFIAQKLDMDLDEVEKLRSQAVMAEEYAHEEYSQAWEPDGFIDFADELEADGPGDYDTFALPQEGHGPTAADLADPEPPGAGAAGAPQAPPHADPEKES
ncbi:ParB N-terminal domain-containing protein [Nocardiopsis sp. NPDC006198]|uniref:ParB N-terminal domain-containing protein n=1 Tax=Nocardiopsis sp. NPDC006198 TaxID=3154472 RepID=UPI0033AF587C